MTREVRKELWARGCLLFLAADKIDDEASSVCLYLLVLTQARRMCVYRKLSQVFGSHFYNEKSSNEMQLNKMRVSVTVTELSPSQSEAAD